MTMRWFEDDADTGAGHYEDDGLGLTGDDDGNPIGTSVVQPTTPPSGKTVADGEWKKDPKTGQFTWENYDDTTNSVGAGQPVTGISWLDNILGGITGGGYKFGAADIGGLAALAAAMMNKPDTPEQAAEKADKVARAQYKASYDLMDQPRTDAMGNTFRPMSTPTSAVPMQRNQVAYRGNPTGAGMPDAVGTPTQGFQNNPGAHSAVDQRVLDAYKTANVPVYGTQGLDYWGGRLQHGQSTDADLASELAKQPRYAIGGEVIPADPNKTAMDLTWKAKFKTGGPVTVEQAKRFEDAIARNDYADAVDAARDAGYSNDEIAPYLAKLPHVRAAGWTPQEVAQQVTNYVPPANSNPTPTTVAATPTPSGNPEWNIDPNVNMSVPQWHGMSQTAQDAAIMAGLKGPAGQSNELANQIMYDYGEDPSRIGGAISRTNAIQQPTITPPGTPGTQPTPYIPPYVDSPPTLPPVPPGGSSAVNALPEVPTMNYRRNTIPFSGDFLKYGEGPEKLFYDKVNPLYTGPGTVWNTTNPPTVSNENLSYIPPTVNTQRSWINPTNAFTTDIAHGQTAPGANAWWDYNQLNGPMNGQQNQNSPATGMQVPGTPPSPGYAHGGMTGMIPPHPTGQTGSISGVTGGQADKVNAALSHGEFIVDSDVVSALGDGNTEAGAAALDRMREEVRRHKRSAPISMIPPKAKKPMAYMKGGN